MMEGMVMDGTAGWRPAEDEEKGLRVNLEIDPNNVSDTELALLAAQRGMLVQTKTEEDEPHLQQTFKVKGGGTVTFPKQREVYDLYLNGDVVGGKKSWLARFRSREELVKVLTS